MSAIARKISEMYYLVSVPTFAAGAATCFDLYGALNTYRYSESAREADGREIASDWAATGYDIGQALEKYEQQA